MSDSSDRETEHPIYASAGMVAAGMVRQRRSAKEPTPASYGIHAAVLEAPEEAPLDQALPEDEIFVDELPDVIAEQLPSVPEPEEEIAEVEDRDLVDPTVAFEEEKKMAEEWPELEAPIITEAEADETPEPEVVSEEEPGAGIDEDAEEKTEAFKVEFTETVWRSEKGESKAELEVDADADAEKVSPSSEEDSDDSESFIQEIFVGEDAPETSVIPPHLQVRRETPEFEKFVSAENTRKLVAIGPDARVDQLKREAAIHQDLAIFSPEAYDDPADLIASTQPEMVAVLFDQKDKDTHHLIRCALDQGAHVLSSLPFCRKLKDGDRLVDLARAKGLQLAVDNPSIASPIVRRAVEESEALIGDLLEIRVYGEMGVNSGGTDLLLQGLPLFDVVRAFGGAASWCTADITHRGARALPEHVFQSPSGNLGPVLGDRVFAQIVLDSGVHVTFVSDPHAGAVCGPAGLELIGSKTKMRIFSDGVNPPAIALRKPIHAWSCGRSDTWSEWVPAFGSIQPENSLELWLRAIEDEDASLPNSAENALLSLEIAHGIWQSGLRAKRAYFPLVNRLHPLAEESF